MSEKEDIIQQLLQFGIGGTKEEILDAINHAINKTDINEIADYITNKEERKNALVIDQYVCFFVYISDICEVFLHRQLALNVHGMPVIVIQLKD